MPHAPRLASEKGIALFTVLLVSLALSALIIGGALVTTNSTMIRRYSERMSALENAALSGLDEGRSQLNGTPLLYPDSGFVTLESGAAVLDAAGNVIPGLSRTTYAGPSGVSSGQFGVFGSVISTVSDNANILMVRRMEIDQESFAKFAYFTDNENAGICFGGTDQIFGPVHSNDDICIWGGSNVRFRDEVRTAGQVNGAANATFDKGYLENVPNIPLPTVAAMNKLQTQAGIGGTSFAGFTTGGAGSARTRIEFVAVDLNGDGDVTDDDEGFFRVYQGAAGQEDFVSAVLPAGTKADKSINCGDLQGPHTGLFADALSHPGTGHSQWASLNDNSARCHLGGDPVLTNGFVPSTSRGAWLPWGGAIDPALAALRPLEAPYLHPLSRGLNPNFKGVIFVNGKVAISGTVRGRVTIASPNDIIIADNLRQASDPSVGVCDDIVGIFSMGNVTVADNLINAPVAVNSAGTVLKTMRPPAPGNNQDEVIHAVVLALGQFAVQNHTTGPTNKEKCETTNWGRGCLRLTGGIIQSVRGPVGTSAGTGNLKRYSYNTCALTDPPPYFPTTGHFSRNRFYSMDPVGFDINTWFTLYQQ